MSNTGFVDAPTAHAGAGSTSVPGLGTFAPLAGPTIGPNGTVFLGTREGKVIALHADGKPFWNRELPAGQTITAPPALGSDGSVYVVGSTVTRDHRPGSVGQTGRPGCTGSLPGAVLRPATPPTSRSTSMAPRSSARRTSGDSAPTRR